MRLTSGYLKGMTLKTPKGDTTRPTAARVREAVFSMLGDDLEGAVFWDLFAGSGGIGLHAASLGATQVVFVEQAKGATNILATNIAEAETRLQIQGAATQFHRIAGDLKQQWQRLLRYPRPTHLWLDPPYADTAKWVEFILQALSQDVVPPWGRVTVIMEAEAKAAADLELITKRYPAFSLDRERHYGDTMILLGERA